MNHFTSVLAARIGTSQPKALLRGERIGEDADAAVLKVWNAILRLLKAKPTPPDFQTRLHLLLVEVYRVARREIGNGLVAQSQAVHREASAIVFDALPPGHRSLLAQLHAGPPALAENKKPTPQQERRMRDMIFPAQSQAQAESIVYRPTSGASWQARLAQQTRLASPAQLASLVSTWRASGQSPQELQRQMMPYVQGVRSTARRVARTEAQRVAMQSRLDAYEQLGDLVVGYQIHATMDSRTRPHHAARNGQVYYKNPRPGQLGLKDMPQPPQEADGTVAHNCRCWLTPVVDVQPQVERDPDAKRSFFDAEANLVPDPASYKDWFDSAPYEEMAMAVGKLRLAAVAKKLIDGEKLSWTHFLNPVTGNLLTTDELRRETLKQRDRRVRRANAVIQQRRILARRIAQFGYLRPAYHGVLKRLGNAAAT